LPVRDEIASAETSGMVRTLSHPALPEAFPQ
jgi:hypothetical protein